MDLNSIWTVPTNICKPPEELVFPHGRYWKFTNQLTNQLTKTIHLRQVSQVANRFDFVKVTTRGRGVTAAEIAAKVTRPGAALILR